MVKHIFMLTINIDCILTAHSTTTKTNKSIKKLAEDLNRHFQKRYAITQKDFQHH